MNGETPEGIPKEFKAQYQEGFLRSITKEISLRISLGNCRETFKTLLTEILGGMC